MVIALVSVRFLIAVWATTKGEIVTIPVVSKLQEISEINFIGFLQD
jgi:hypothetical protein